MSFWSFGSLPWHVLWLWPEPGRSIFLINSSGIISGCHPPGLFSWMDYVTFLLLSSSLIPECCCDLFAAVPTKLLFAPGSLHPIATLQQPKRACHYSAFPVYLVRFYMYFSHASDTSSAGEQCCNALFPLDILCVWLVNSSTFKT